ncbi:MAG: hypothetical protein WC242_05250 [Candidatus Paceibacterota bacterium]|jgi:hypothetical protein
MNKKYLKWLIVGSGLSVLGGAFLFGSYAIIEPTRLTAVSSATTTSVTLTVDEQISLTPPASIALSPNIDTTQQSSVGSGSWTVKTNANGGYTLKFTTSGANALTNGGSGSFTDISTTTPITWSEADAGSYVWGYSAYGNDVATSTWGNAVSCGTAAVDVASTSLNYAGFATTTGATQAAASSGTVTTPSGTATTLCIAAEQGDSIYAPTGVYTATVTGTAATQ